MVASGDIDPPPGRDVLEHLFLHSGWEVPRSRDPGEVMQYANFNYTLIGEIIRRVTGGTLDAEMRRFVFDPVGMSSSAVIVREPLLSRVVERPPGSLTLPATRRPCWPCTTPSFSSATTVAPACTPPRATTCVSWK